jgi:hypothetical protein
MGLLCQGYNRPYDGDRGFRERIFAQTVFGGIHGPTSVLSALRDRNAKVIVDKERHAPSVDPLAIAGRTVPEWLFTEAAAKAGSS